MDVISLLRTPFVLVKKSLLEELRDETIKAKFTTQEAYKLLARARQEAAESNEKWHLAIDQLTKAHSDLESMEQLVSESEETKVLAVAQLDTLKEEVSYLKEQVKIYQARIGLLPQERQLF